VVQAASLLTAAKLTKTRIDFLLAPDIDGLQWSGTSGTDFLRYERRYGHNMVHTRLHVAKESRGSDLKFINEKIYDDLNFNKKVAETIEDTISSTNPAVHGWGTAWEAIKKAVRELSLKRTAALKKKNTKEIQRLRALSRICEERISSGMADTSTFANRDHLREQLRALSIPPRSIADGLDTHAYELGQQHEISSAAFYKKWKPRAAAQRIAKHWKADWSDPTKPKLDSKAAETDPTKMASVITEYYKQLFAKKTTHEASRRRALETLQSGASVSEPTKAALGTNISKEEIASVSNHLPENKSPGPSFRQNRLPNTRKCIRGKPAKRNVTTIHAPGHHLPAIQKEASRRPPELQTDYTLKLRLQNYDAHPRRTHEQGCSPVRLQRPERFRARRIYSRKHNETQTNPGIHRRRKLGSNLPIYR
jgi:hypothetical protein